MVRRPDIDTDKIIQLYQSGLIGREIAEELGCSIALVQQRLAKAGVKMRPCNNRKTVDIAPDVLQRLYWEEQKHPVAIGKMFGVHKNTIIKKLLAYGIPMRDKSAARIGALNPIYGVGHSKKTREKMSDLFFTGQRSLEPLKNNQYGKRMEYKDFVFRSSWEYGFAKFLDANGIPWKYEPDRLGYRFKGQNRTYIPDFYLPKGWTSKEPIYVEIKGYATKKEKYKIRAIQRSVKNLVVLYREDLIELGIIGTSGALIEELS